MSQTQGKAAPHGSGNAPVTRGSRGLGVPDDVGGVAAFLCSEAGRWVSGQLVEAGMFL